MDVVGLDHRLNLFTDGKDLRTTRSTLDYIHIRPNRLDNVQSRSRTTVRGTIRRTAARLARPARLATIPSLLFVVP